MINCFIYAIDRQNACPVFPWFLNFGKLFLPGIFWQFFQFLRLIPLVYSSANDGAKRADWELKSGELLFS